MRCVMFAVMCVMCVGSVRAFAQEAEPSKTKKGPEVVYGTRHLPEAHFCHDMASVVVTDDAPAGSDRQWMTRTHTVKELRDEPDMYWIGIGARTARSLFWREGDRRMAVLSCALSGTGYYLDEPALGSSLSETRLRVGPVGEPSSPRRAMAVWVEQVEAKGPWVVRDVLSVGDSSYEGERQWVDLVNTVILDARDRDSDGHLDVAVMSITECSYIDDICNTSEGEYMDYGEEELFLITLLVRDGADRETIGAVITREGQISRTSVLDGREVSEKPLPTWSDDLLVVARGKAIKLIEDIERGSHITR